MAEGREEIFRRDLLLRRAFRSHADRKNPGRVLPVVFMRGKIPEFEPQCSVNVDRLIREPGEVMKGALGGQRIAVLAASVPIDLSLPVIHEPEIGVYSHAHILNIIDLETCSKLASKAKMLTREETMHYA